VIVCEKRDDGLWPVLKLHDVRRASVMKAPPMEVSGPEKQAGLAVAPLRRCLEGLLQSSWAGPVREMLEDLVGTPVASTEEDRD
jgi:hypothetical protein